VRATILKDLKFIYTSTINLNLSTMNMNKRLISIIDDDSICRMLVKKQIECSEYETQVFEYENGHLAFQDLKSITHDPSVIPDVIFLDLFMPVMDGWEFLDELSKVAHIMAKSPQIYILSTSINVVDIERAEENPLVTGFIPKPIKLRQIQRIIHKIKYYGLTG